MTSQIFTSYPGARTSNKHGKIMDTYIKLCSNTNCLISTDSSPSFTTTPVWQWSPKVNMQLLHLKKNSTPHSIIAANFSDILHSEFQDFNFIYTDASKTSVGVGFAYYTSHASRLFKLPPEASIFTAETQSIKKALMFAK